MNTVIHRAVRRDLVRFVDATARFREGDRARAGQLTTAWDHFDLQLTRHHEGEHEIAWPALERVGVSRELIATFDAEHEVMAERLAAARGAMAALRSDPTGARGQAAHDALVELQAVTVRHLDHEEAEIEPILVGKRDDPAIKEMGKQFARGGPKEGGVVFAWLADGATTEEMRALDGSVPKPVRKVLVALFGRAYARDVAPAWRS